jgi:hypothetical protein
VRISMLDDILSRSLYVYSGLSLAGDCTGSSSGPQAVYGANLE